ncbi:MAG TPA: circadian clock protein KaiC, partial [Flavobacteriales bacterium]|nr:circadian clock protein KaiC [Flavobacteriales bacterium]
LDKLVKQKKIFLDHVKIERSEIEETGEYDLEGLFIRLGHAVDSIGAKRVVLDTLEALFASLPNEAVLRAELRRLFRWLKDRGLTAVITGERGEKSLTRYGLEEYVADCVILLDHRVRHQISTRRLRIVKYRGSSHGTNEYPFLITDSGFSVLPITSMLLEHKASSQRISSGVKDLDAMMRGGGFYRGSSILVTGSAGTGKSSLAAAFLHAACARAERALLFAYEESPSQIIRNMRSIGYDLEHWVKKGLLGIHASRPTLGGLEQHLVAMHRTIVEFKPAVVVVDPISNLTMERKDADVKPMLMRLIDHLKVRNITALFTSLTDVSATMQEDSEVGVSSLMDTWLLLRNVEHNGERSRALVLLKARGIAHSNQVREFVLSDKGVALIDIHVQDGRVITGRARIAVEQAATAAPSEQRRAASVAKTRKR